MSQAILEGRKFYLKLSLDSGGTTTTKNLRFSKIKANTLDDDYFAFAQDVIAILETQTVDVYITDTNRIVSGP